MRLQSLLTFAVVSAIFTAAATRSASANQIYLPVAVPVSPAAVDHVPAVKTVPGKKYTDSLDMTHVPTPHQLRPSQVGHWDGIGGARDGLYLAEADSFFGEFNIDAQSQTNDALFDAVINNRAPLIVSTSFDGMLGNDVSLAAERNSGAVESFARRRQIVDHPHPGGLLRDIDSVDLWGPENDEAAGFYSFKTDPNNTAVYSQTFLGPGSVQPYLSKTQIANAIDDPNVAPQIDIDGLMVRDIGTGFNPFDGEFNEGDAIMFSIAPILTAAGDVRYDGGEIWVWEFGQPARFLEHGGHKWDTAFDVAGAFGVNTQNIDALEAVGSVPEPASLAILLGGVFAAFGYRRRS